MDRFGAMRSFVEIVDQGSLTAASRSLGKSLPTMVRTLAELEHSLGVVLLRRTTRRMSLTAEGEVYLEHCRRLVTDVAEVEALMRTGHAEPKGALRVTAPVLFGGMHVAPAVTEFVERYPGVDVDLILLDRVVNLVEEGIDVAVRIGSLPDSTMIATTVGHMRHVVVASPKLLRREGTPKHPSDLADRTCVRFTGTSTIDNWRFVDKGKEIQVSVRGNMRCNHAAPMVQACVAGLGFGRFLAYQVAPAVKAKQLRIVLRKFEHEPVPVSLAYAEARMVTKRLRVFIDWMKTQLRSDGALGRGSGR